MDEQLYTIEDVMKSNNHIEMIDGLVVVENKTTVTHNIVVSEIAACLKNHISAQNGNCKVFTENVALYVNELHKDNNNFFLPDVMVVCNTEEIKDDGVHTVPKFVAEVTSESTKKFDYNQKLDIYKKIGVEEYWIVDLQKKAILKYVSKEDYIPQYFLHPHLVEVSSYEGLSIDMSNVIQ